MCPVEPPHVVLNPFDMHPLCISIFLPAIQKQSGPIKAGDAEVFPGKRNCVSPGPAAEIQQLAGTATAEMNHFRDIDCSIAECLFAEEEF